MNILILTIFTTTFFTSTFWYNFYFDIVTFQSSMKNHILKTATKWMIAAFTYNYVRRWRCVKVEGYFSSVKKCFLEERTRLCLKSLQRCRSSSGW
jgi:hypothetical protein